MFRLRLIRLIILWLFQKQVSLLGTYRFTLRAWPIIDCDVTRMMVHAFTRALVLGRYHLVFGGEFRNWAFKRRWYPMTVSEITSIFRPVKIFEKFHVESRIICWDEKRFYAEQKLWVGDDLRARSLVEGLMAGPEGFINPREVFSKMEVNRSSPEFTEEILAWNRNRYKRPKERGGAQE